MKQIENNIIPDRFHDEDSFIFLRTKNTKWLIKGIRRHALVIYSKYAWILNDNDIEQDSNDWESHCSIDDIIEIRHATIEESKLCTMSMY